MQDRHVDVSVILRAWSQDRSHRQVAGGCGRQSVLLFNSQPLLGAAVALLWRNYSATRRWDMCPRNDRRPCG